MSNPPATPSSPPTLSPPTTGAGTTLPRARRFRFPWILLLLGLALAGSGAWLAVRHQPELQVSGVRISIKPGIDLSKLLSFSKPDLFVEVWTAEGKIKSKVVKNAVIGSGLTIPLPEQVPHGRIVEVKIFDEGRLSDSLLDRADRPPVKVDGEKFRMELIGQLGAGVGKQRAGYVLAGLGGLSLLAALARLVRFQAV